MRGARGAVTVSLACACGAASAHSPVAGIGDFYSGMLHPVLVPAHLLAIVAMGLWLGQRWPANGEAWAAMMLALPVGMAVSALTGERSAEGIVLGLAMWPAAATAANRAGPRGVQLVIAALLGAMLGADSMPDGLSGKPLVLSLSGTWLSVLLLLAALVVVGEFATRPWMRIGLRAIASWVVAAALLVLALSWLGPRSSPAAAAATAAPSTPR